MGDMRAIYVGGMVGESVERSRLVMAIARCYELEIISKEEARIALGIEYGQREPVLAREMVEA